MTEEKKQREITCVGHFLGAADSSHDLEIDPEPCEPLLKHCDLFWSFR